MIFFKRGTDAAQAKAVALTVGFFCPVKAAEFARRGYDGVCNREHEEIFLLLDSQAKVAAGWVRYLFTYSYLSSIVI